MDLKRREFLGLLGRSGAATLAGVCAAGTVLSSSTGCSPPANGTATPQKIWGRLGLSEGRLHKPRAMTISNTDEIYIVDTTGRIQVFDTDGNYQRGWRTPFIKNGKPTGMGWGNDDTLLVADTHYFRVLFYHPDGTLDETRSIGGTNGFGPGEFQFVTDVAQDQRGHYFVGQYGQNDLIQEFDPECKFVRRWGRQGEGPGEFSRPQALLVDDDGLLWIADACNHRIQIYDVSKPEPELVGIWGSAGREPGQLKSPYGIVFDQDGTLLVAEFGNHRVQRFTKEGESLECWGEAGKGPGQFIDPWALILDSKQQLHVADTKNHRVQTFDLA